MKHLAPVLLSLPLLLASCTSVVTPQSQAPAPRMNRSRINIGAYYLQDYARTEAHVKDLADCGIDFVTNMGYDRPTLDLFQKYGVGAVVTGILPGWWGGNGKGAGTMYKVNPWKKYVDAAKKFQDHPAIWGIDTGDEPSALDFPYYGEILRKLPALFPNQFCYLNLYPNYASVAKNNAEETICQLGTKTYAEHIARYAEEVDTDYICYDYYMYSAGVPGHYENLRIVADACRASGRSLWIVLQVNSSKPDMWISENQLRAQAYSSLAFGAENIIWACYTAGWWHNQVVDKQGNKTQQYDKLKAVNAELHAISDAYMSFRNASTHFVGFPEKSPWLAKLLQTTPVKTFSNGIFRNVNGDSIIVGEMTSRNGDSRRALMIFAADDPADNGNKPVSVSFTCDRKVSCVGARASLTKAEDGTYTLKMNSNDGALIISE